MEDKISEQMSLPSSDNKEDQKDDQHYTVVMQWSIENFSCWKFEIHGERISQNAAFDEDEYDWGSGDDSKDDDFEMDDESSEEDDDCKMVDENPEEVDEETESSEDDDDDTIKDDSDFKYEGENIICLDLYPIGLSGEDELADEFMAVRVYDEYIENEIELSFFDFSGNLLCKVKKTNIVRDNNSDFVEVSTDLKFKDVVSNIVQDPKHVDVLKIQYTRKSLVSKSYCICSKVNLCERLVQIPLENISNLPLMNKFVASLFYHLEGESRTDLFYASSIKSTAKGLEYKFELKPSKRYSNLVRCYIYLLSSDNSPIRFKEYEHLVSEENSWVISDLLPGVVVQKGFSLNIRLKIISSAFYHCSFSTYSENYEASEIVPSPSSSRREEAITLLSEDLLGLYQDQDFTDIELRCGEASFPAHRGILSTRSPVFKAMLSEVTSCSIEVEDLDVHTLNRFLTFLYTGTSREALQWEEALKLYHAADKYQVPFLQKECASVLKRQVSVANVCEVLYLAERYLDEGLKAAAIEFVVNNYEEVLKSEEWEGFMRKDPVLLCKTLTDLGKIGFVGKR